MKQVEIIVNGQSVEVLPIPVYVRKPRYKWLPRFFMRWRRFRIEYVLPSKNGIEIQGKSPIADEIILVQYETTYGEFSKEENYV